MQQSWRNLIYFDENNLNLCIKKVTKMFCFATFFKFLNFEFFFSYLEWLHQVTVFATTAIQLILDMLSSCKFKLNLKILNDLTLMKTQKVV